MSYSVGQIQARVGKPTFNVWDPVVSDVRVSCPRCSRRCFVALNGRTLLDPRYTRPIQGKNQQKHDRIKYAARRHDEVCEWGPRR